MNSWKILTLSLLTLASASMAATRIGGGSATVPTATIKGVELQNNGLAWFTINEYANHYYRWDATTTTGKNMLSMILTAKAANTPVCFNDNGLITGLTNEYNFDAFWVNP